MDYTLTITELLNTKEILRRKDLVFFFRDAFPGISDSNINWKIQNLTRNGLLERAGVGRYIHSKRKPFKFDNYEIVPKLSKYLEENFPYLLYSIWDTRTLSRLTVHQPARFMIVLEVERGLEMTLFNFLKESYKDVFIKPDQREYDLYIADREDPVIIKSGVTQSPLMLNSGVKVPRLEKVLVDLFVDDIIFTPFQGAELTTIFKNAFKLYSVNLTTMLRYAGRRGAKKRIMQFLSAAGLQNYILRIKH